MKLSDVQIGGIYLTRVSGELRKVKVLRAHTETRYLRYGETRSRQAFIVLAVDRNVELDKPRSAAALREVP